MIIQKLVENLDPQSVGNVLYETMLDWNAVTQRIRMVEPGETQARLVGRRISMEQMLGRFFGVSQSQMHKMLKRHFEQEWQ